jgi:excisionase family DNA binding protein
MAGGAKTSIIAALPAIAQIPQPSPLRHRVSVTGTARCSDGYPPLSYRIFSDLVYISPDATHGGRMTDEILTIREVAELLKINKKTAYKLALTGKIPGFKVGGSWRFERQEIVNWIKRKVEEKRGGNGVA